MSTDDDHARQQALRAKRDALYARQAERMSQQRQAENEANFRRYLGDALTQAGVPHEVLWHRDQRLGPVAQYPTGISSVNWDYVPHAVQLPGGTDAILEEQFEAALRALDIAPSGTVIVDWYVDSMPRVALSAADACAQALALIQQGSDMWAYADDAEWLVEVYHEGHVSYAPRPGRPEHAGDGWRRWE